MTREDALKLFDISIDDFNNTEHEELSTYIASKFRELVKNHHPDMAGNTTSLSITQIKEARDVLNKFLLEKNGNIDDDICPYCLGEGKIKVVKGFNVVDEICSCIKIKRKS